MDCTMNNRQQAVLLLNYQTQLSKTRNNRLASDDDKLICVGKLGPGVRSQESGTRTQRAEGPKGTRGQKAGQGRSLDQA